MSPNLFIAVAVATVMLGVCQPAHAAPQMLAVAATDVPQPLHCANGVCAAEFSSFCLQKERSNPAPGTPYTAYSDAAFTLVYTDRQGTTQRTDANHLIRIASNRGFTSVVARVDKSTLDAIGADGAALEVVQGATLIPAPLPDDTTPITEQEIATAIETLRPMAAQWLGGTDDAARTVRLVNTLINQTPLIGRLSEGERSGLWEKITSAQGNTPADLNGAKEMYDACLWRVEVRRYASMRDCLAIKHDSLLQDMNLSYWKAMEAGS